MRQKGFTLVELLVVLAVGSVILMGALLAIYQVVLGTGRTNSQVVALTEVNHAALQIKKDLMMTHSANLTDGVLQSSVKLTWADFTSFPAGNQTHSSSYVLSDTGVLVRTYDSTESVVGRNITSVTFVKDAQDDRVIHVVITATGPSVPQRSETLKFSAYIRAGEIE